MNQVQASSFPALAGALLVAVAMSGCDQLCGKTGKLCVGQLNDTGVTTCSNADTNGLPCNDTSSGTDAYRGQDAEYGRDVTANDDRDGRAGFVFTKLGADGKPLAIQNGTWDDAGSEAAGTRWTCVRDEITQRVWEVKTNDPASVHDRDHMYSWYDPDSATNGGSAGTPNGGTCAAAQTSLGYGCDTDGFAKYVNDTGGLCGFVDWRVPAADEIQSLADFSVANPAPAIDQRYFPNSDTYWSATPSSHDVNLAFRVAKAGFIGAYDKAVLFRVRLVRGGP